MFRNARLMIELFSFPMPVSLQDGKDGHADFKIILKIILQAVGDGFLYVAGLIIL